MSPYKLRRCSVCGQFHASYLVPDGKGGNLHYCYSCWKAWQAARPPAGEMKSIKEPKETGQGNEGTTDTQ